jgi:ABC-type transport system involved in resistance to organic solvents, periplasmic component
MDKRIGQQVRVGIFVFIGLILSMAVIFLLGEGVTLFERQYVLRARFDDISGLRLGAPVYVAGISVGQVDKIRFPQQLEDKKVVIDLKLKKTYQDRIRENSEASITTQGLLGDKAIFVTIGSPEFRPLEDGDELKVKQGLSLNALADQGQQLLENINEMTKSARELIGDIKKEKGLLYSLIYDPEGKEVLKDLARITRSAGDVLAEVKNGRGVLHALVYDPTSRDLGKVFSDTASNFKSLSKDLGTMGQKMNKGEGTIGGLINDPTVYYDMMTLLGKANRNKLLRTVIRATLATNEADLIEK